jgi:hypothetical protein
VDRKRCARLALHNLQSAADAADMTMLAITSDTPTARLKVTTMLNGRRAHIVKVWAPMAEARAVWTMIGDEVDDLLSRHRHGAPCAVYG